MTFRVHSIESSRLAATLLGLAAAGLGAAVLVGWALDISRLKSVFPGLATMKANTATGLAICGIAIAALSRRNTRRGTAAAVVVAAWGVIAAIAATLLQDVSGWNLGIDEFIVHDTTGALEATSPGRIPPAGAFCFLLSATALIAASRPLTNRLRIAIVLGLGTSIAIIGALGLLGQVSSLVLGVRWWNHAGMAIHSNFGFLLLGLGFLALVHTTYELKWSFSRPLTAAFMAGIGLLVAAASLSYSYIVHLRDDAIQVARSKDVLDEIESVERRLADLESAQRGYVITGDESLLSARGKTISVLLGHLARVRTLMAPDPEKQHLLDIAEQLVAQRIAFGEKTLDVRRRQGLMHAQRLVSTGTGIELTQRISAIFSDLQSAETIRLGERSRQTQSMATATLLLSPMGAYLSLTTLLLALYILNATTIERTHADEARQASDSRYREFVEQSTDGIAILDMQGRFQYVNPRACELLGYTANELAGADHRITYLPDERPATLQRIARAKAGEVLRYERTVVRKDGSTFPAEFSSRLITSGVFQILFHDITERRDAESRLRESEEKYRQLVEQASDGIFISDDSGTFLHVNTRGCELLGYTPEEMVGMNGRVTYLDEEHDLHAQRMQEVRAGGVLRFDRMVRRKDGSLFPAEISVKKLDNGLVQVIFHDITERRRAQQALLAERTLLRTLIDALPDVVFTKDHAGRFTMCNAAAYRNSGFAHEREMIGKTVFDLYPREMAQQYHDDDMAALGGRSVVNREEAGLDAAGTHRWFLTIKVPLTDNAGRISGMVGISRDITQRKQHEDKIERLNRIKSMLSGINSAIVRVHDPENLFQEACRIATELGNFPIALIGMLDGDGQLVPAGSGGAGPELLAALPPGARGGPRGVAVRSIRERVTIVENDLLREPDVDEFRKQAIARGCRSVISLPLYREKEVVGMFMLYGRVKDAFDAEEVTILEELAGDVSFALTFIAQRKKVDYLAYYDTLTDLPNRSLFFDRLARQVAAAGRDRSSVALVLLDVDRFGMVNETLGREAGDRLLKSIAERIRGAVREEDAVARMGADGFAIAASGHWRAEELAHLVESRNRMLFHEAFDINGEELRISATAGIAVFPQDAGNPEALVANAEAALRSARAQNAPLMFYGPEMNARAADSIRMETRLRRAIEKQELALWYQPKIDLRTGRLTGMEALMRWHDPESGMVSPAKFIPLMEQTGLILDAGNWALSRAAHDCAGWQDDAPGPLRIAVNVSPLQLRARDFVATVINAAEALERVGGVLDLEITESVIMENVDAIIPKLQTLQGIGVRIFVDDFGTGYSSLAYIARLPIHALKVDRAFVVGMTQDQDSLSIVMSIISLAHALSLRVVAEGVETEEQAELLRQLRCDELQGYLYGRPVPPSEIPSVIKQLS